MQLLVSVYMKLPVLYSPFFVLACFISLSRGFGPRDRTRMAWRVALAALIASVARYLFGRDIFIVFGIT
ncbi:MarC family protein, partial [Pseudomonas aeruginosa]